MCACVCAQEECHLRYFVMDNSIILGLLEKPFAEDTGVIPSSLSPCSPLSPLFSLSPPSPFPPLPSFLPLSSFPPLPAFLPLLLPPSSLFLLPTN